MLDKGEGPRGSMCESVNPTTVQIWLTGRFSPKGHPWRCQFRPSTITSMALRGWNHNQHRRDQGLPPPQSPLPSPDHGFESDRSLLSTVSSMSSLSEGQKVPGIPSKVDDMGRLDPTWKLIYLSLKMRMQRILWPTRGWGGIWWYTIVWDDKIIHSFCMPFGPSKVTPEN